jgi:beta-barrel assembly-enhancing protease
VNEPAAPRLENRPAPDDPGHDEHPLREVAWLLAGSAVVLVSVVLALGFAAKWLAPKLPFAAERALAERLLPEPAPADAAAVDRTAALKALTDRVTAQMSLTPEMSVMVAYRAGSEVNAYATIGGRIRIHQGLLARLRGEDELAALIAHEVAHVKHRHVAANLGRGLTLALLLGVLSADAGAAVAQGLLGQAVNLALMGYSREQERDADREAIAAVVALYGHAGGMLALMQRLADEEARQGQASGTPALLRSHPHTTERIAELRELAQQRAWPLSGKAPPLPAPLQLPMPDGKRPTGSTTP